MNGEYRTHREHVLYETAKAQLPATQPMAQNYRTVQALRLQLADMEHEHARLRLTQPGYLYIPRYAQLLYDMRAVKARIERIILSRYESDGTRRGVRILEDREESTQTFVRACPVEGCRGFLSQDELRCGLCETYACGECLGVRGDNHSCDPNDVETAKVILKESKPCPACGIRISKINGCDQMWCVQCHTAFSWDKGVVVRGTIHNPHYFEELRRHAPNGEIPRQPGDVPGMPRGWNIPWGEEWRRPGINTFYDPLHNKLRQLDTPPTMFTNIMENHRDLVEVRYTIIPKIRRQPTDTLDLRIKYLVGELPETEFKRHLILRERSIEKNRAIEECMEAQIEATKDVYQHFLEREDVSLDDFVDQLRHINELTDLYMRDIKQRFKCTIRNTVKIHLYERHSPKRMRVE